MEGVLQAEPGSAPVAVVVTASVFTGLSAVTVTVAVAVAVAARFAVPRAVAADSECCAHGATLSSPLRALAMLPQTYTSILGIPSTINST